MDERLSGYINNQIHEPPLVNERQIAAELARRGNRVYLILLSVTGLLWTMLLYVVSFTVGKENQTAGIVLLTIISVSYICAGWFAGIVIKFRKVVL